MKNLIKIIFSLVILNLILNVNAHAQTVTWQKWYDYNNRENAGEDVIQTFDRGYAIINNNYGNGLFSVLLKLDNLGNLEWQTILDISATGASLQSYNILQSKDSGYVISGDSNGDSAFILKTNNSGSIQWLRKYSPPGVTLSRFFDHRITNNGGFIACGGVYPFNGYVVRTDSNGNVLWDSTYDGTTFDIASSKDGNFYLISSAGLRKIDSIGKTIWLTSFPYYMNSIVLDSLDYIYTAGGIDSAYVFKYDSSGYLQWNKKYGIMHCHSMCLTFDNNILVAGTYDTLIQTGIHALKVKLNGDLIFTKKIRSVNGDWFVIPYAVNSTSDNGFIFTGQTDYPGFPYDDNAIVVKTDSECYAPLVVGIYNSGTNIVEDFNLEQNYPNPFNSSTIINYEIPVQGLVSIKIYNIQGKEITTLKNEFQNNGKHSLIFNAENYFLASGIYIYQIETQKSIKIKKMFYLK